MTPLTQWPELLAKITPERAEAYLRGRGWEVYGEYEHFVGWRKTPEGGRVHHALIPRLVEDAGDVADAGGALKEIARAESRSPLAILSDLVGAEAVWAAVEFDLGPHPGVATATRVLAKLRGNATTALHDLPGSAVASEAELREGLECSAYDGEWWKEAPSDPKPTKPVGGSCPQWNPNAQTWGESAGE